MIDCMSYDISLNNPVSHEVIMIESPHFMQGGTYQLGGTQELWLNITYNYAKYYYEVYPESGIREIYGKSGADSIPILENLISKIEKNHGKATDKDYWKATPGNAIAPLYQLIAMAKMRPDGIWDGD